MEKPVHRELLTVAEATPPRVAVALRTCRPEQLLTDGTTGVLVLGGARGRDLLASLRAAGLTTPCVLVQPRPPRDRWRLEPVAWAPDPGRVPEVVATFEQITPTVVDLHGVRFDPVACTLQHDPHALVLSAREAELLRTLWAHGGWVSTAELCRRLGDPAPLQTKALQMVVSRLRKRAEQAQLPSPSSPVFTLGRSYALATPEAFAAAMEQPPRTVVGRRGGGGVIWRWVRDQMASRCRVVSLDGLDDLDRTGVVAEAVDDGAPLVVAECARRPADLPEPWVAWVDKGKGLSRLSPAERIYDAFAGVDGVFREDDVAELGGTHELAEALARGSVERTPDGYRATGADPVPSPRWVNAWRRRLMTLLRQLLREGRGEALSALRASVARTARHLTRVEPAERAPHLLALAVVGEAVGYRPWRERLADGAAVCTGPWAAEAGLWAVRHAPEHAEAAATALSTASEGARARLQALRERHATIDDALLGPMLARCPSAPTAAFAFDRALAAAIVQAREAGRRPLAMHGLQRRLEVARQVGDATLHDIVLQQIVELGADVPALTWRDRAALCCG